MYCERCGAQMSPDARFCAVCGAKVAAPEPAAQPDTDVEEPTHGFTLPPQAVVPPAAEPTYAAPIGEEDAPLVDPLPDLTPIPGGKQPKKKIPVKVTIAVLAGIAVLLAAVYIFIVPLLREKDPDPATETTQPVQETAAPVTEPAPQTAAPEATTGAFSPLPQTNPANSKYAPGTYINTAISEINLRETPSRGANKVGEVRQGERAVITEVYEDPAAGSRERWWGKTSVRGAEGWVALYYMSSADLKDATLDNGQVAALLTKLKGYWNMQNAQRFFAVLQDTEAFRIVIGPWYSEADMNAFCTAPVRGDIGGLISIHLYSPGGESGGVSYPPVDGDILLDVSESDNGRIVWINGTTWEEFMYAGATEAEAMPPMQPAG